MNLSGNVEVFYCYKEKTVSMNLCVFSGINYVFISTGIFKTMFVLTDFVQKKLVLSEVLILFP